MVEVINAENTHQWLVNIGSVLLSGSFQTLAVVPGFHLGFFIKGGGWVNTTIIELERGEDYSNTSSIFPPQRTIYSIH